MMYSYRTLFLCLLLAFNSLFAHAADHATLPEWLELEFEEKAFWATANSRLKLTASPEGDGLWQFEANSSVPGNSEQVTIQLDPGSGGLLKRERISHGKKDSRFKSYRYEDEHLLRERREPSGDNRSDPREWTLASQTKLFYPQSAAELVISDPYSLILIALELQRQGPEASRQVLVHTDENFYRATLTSGGGIALPVNYTVAGGEPASGNVETLGVALKVEPEGALVDKDDFSLLGLTGDLVIFFDRDTGLPLQVRGQAPRIGDTSINLKSVTMRPAGS